MSGSFAFLVCGWAASLALAGGAVFSHVRARRARARGGAEIMLQAAQDSQLLATRLLRLASHELRGVGMTLHGHADFLAGSVSPVIDPALRQAHVASIAGAAAQILSLADEMQDHAFPALAPRILREEPVELVALLAEAVAAVEAALAPGRRNWRIAATAPSLVWADRRALRHVLSRVLTDAARSTGQEDWIDLSFLPHHDGLALVVADEGAGLATPDAGDGRRGARSGGGMADSRGVGLRLTLARGLMEAHGGRLEVEAACRIGSRVSLVFPAARLRRHDAEAVADGGVRTTN